MTTRESMKVPHVPRVVSIEQRSIGGLLIDSGRIRPEDGDRILRYAMEHGLRFGDAAIALKLVKEEDIQQALSQQFDYPYVMAGESNVLPEVIAAWSPFDGRVEALRALRSQLMLRWFSGEQRRQPLVLASLERGDGRSYLAANLAVVFSQMGEKTLLVDANLRFPRQHLLFGIENATGLSTVLAERADLSVIQRVPSFVDLCVLPSGAVPPNPLELLGKPAFGDLVRKVSDDFDVVIVDSPSVSSGSDCMMLARACGGALALARKHKTKLNALADFIGEAAESGITVVGTVMNEH